LDEPTNHLDIPSAERLEEALRQFSAPAGGFGQNRSPEGTLIIISHDRMLLDNLCDQLLILDGRGGIRHFLGTYSEYLETEGAQDLVKDDTQPVSKSAVRKDKQQPKAGENKRNQKKVATGKTGKKNRYAHMSQAKLEQSIEQAEARLAELDALLADPETYRDHKRFNALHEEREQVQAELTPMEEEWLRRAEQA